MYNCQIASGHTAGILARAPFSLCMSLGAHRGEPLSRMDERRVADARLTNSTNI